MRTLVLLTARDIDVDLETGNGAATVTITLGDTVVLLDVEDAEHLASLIWEALASCCPKCAGTGDSRGPDPCDWCHGTGREDGAA